MAFAAVSMICSKSTMGAAFCWASGAATFEGARAVAVVSSSRANGVVGDRLGSFGGATFAKPTPAKPTPVKPTAAKANPAKGHDVPHGRFSAARAGPAETVSHRRKGFQILSMARDDPLQQLAEDLQRIEEFLPDLDELDKDELQGFLDLELESNMDYETFRHYEIMYLIHEKNADEVQDVIKKVQDFITESKGRIYRVNDWGMRTLAYDIKKAKRANYVLMNIEISSQAVNVLNTLLEKDERVIRHLVMSQKAAITEESVAPEEYRTLRDGDDEEDDEEYEEWDEEEEDEDEEGEEEEETQLVLQKE